LTSCDWLDKSETIGKLKAKLHGTEVQKLTANDTRFPYQDMNNLTPVYNELDQRVGYLVMGLTEECGSDCAQEILFVHGTNNDLKIEKIPELTRDSLGRDMLEKDKYIYLSNPIWREGEGHFGCHNFQLQKVKYINHRFAILSEYTLPIKFALDEGDSNGECRLYPGIKSMAQYLKNLDY
jgi:hypothetical protein